MTDPSAEFFDELGRRGHEPLLAKASGVLRFDLAEGGRTRRFVVTIRKGDIAVSRKNVDADCVVRLDRALFDRIAVGESNGLACLIRGLVAVEGDAELLLLFQRLFPGPPGSRKQAVGTRD
jgi:hypothetical protein